MKVTNYEISKKLAEIGFVKESSYFWDKYGNGGVLWMGGNSLIDKNSRFFAYDLETILDVLPKKIVQNTDLAGEEIEEWQEELVLFPYEIAYCFDTVEGFCLGRFYIIKKDDESLADTAARLLIKLHEQNLIQFGGDNDK